MSVFSDPLRKEIESYLDRYETRRSSILPILHAIQGACGYINDEQIEELHQKYELNRVHVREVITFYDVYKDVPARKYVLRFCNNVTCRMLGSKEAIAKITERIQQYESQMGDDAPFELEEFPCLGKCDGAPVMLCNKDRIEHVTVDKVDDVLGRYAPLPT